MADGVVFLVGAGPGDPGLLTVRARELLESADVVVYDALVSDALVASLRDAERAPELHYVGKRGGERASARQSEIAQLVVKLARQGKRVVRLKGGDPFVFGRGGEEAQACYDADVRFEVVPGVTAGIAAPAYAGIPVTHRGRATSVTLVTGHEDPAKRGGQTDWAALARLASAGGTVVVYMGAKTLAKVVASLRAGGLEPHVPVAVVERGTLPEQRTVVSTVESLVADVGAAGIGPPLVAVFGWTVLLRDEVAWFEKRPLLGRTIAVTRATQRAGTLVSRLRERGSRVIEMPATRIARLDPSALNAAIADLTAYDWLVFTSQNGVTIFWEQLLAAGRDARALAGRKIAAIGPGTASALLERGIAVDVLPARFVAEGLLDTLRGRDDVTGSRVLYVAAEGARDVLRPGIEELGGTVDVVTPYRSARDGKGATELRRKLESDAIDLTTVTSASAVTALVDLVGADAARRAPVASIGPATSAAARDAGLDVAVEAKEATIDSLVDAIVAHF